MYTDTDQSMHISAYLLRRREIERDKRIERQVMHKQRCVEMLRARR